jgi:hypothetical protein
MVDLMRSYGYDQGITDFFDDVFLRGSEMKYELTDETVEIYGVTLYRIRALKDFAGFLEGSLGGFVEGEWNLSQEGGAWVSEDAQVFGGAYISEDAWVSGTSRVSGAAQVFEIE